MLLHLHVINCLIIILSIDKKYENKFNNFKEFVNILFN